jgi:hypothetical protein
LTSIQSYAARCGIKASKARLPAAVTAVHQLSLAPADRQLFKCHKHQIRSEVNITFVTLPTAPVHAYIPVAIHINGHSTHKISVPVEHTFALDAGKSRGQVEGLLTKINAGQVYVWAY